MSKSKSKGIGAEGILKRFTVERGGKGRERRNEPNTKKRRLMTDKRMGLVLTAKAGRPRTSVSWRSS